MRKELLPGEQVIVVTRRQARMLGGPVLVFILVPALAAYGCAWIVKGGPAKLLPVLDATWTPWLLAACIGIAAAIIVGYSLRRFLKWRAVRYILTSRRIVARFGMFRRRDWQVSLAAIRNVGVQQSVLQRIFRSGNISLDTGHPGGTIMTDVPEVAKFRSFILDAIDELPEGEIFEAGAVEDFADADFLREIGGNTRNERRWKR
jgi:uncharacterized membrane protein YdbT with pleckstrin-like domain